MTSPKKEEPADTEEFLVSVWLGGWRQCGRDIDCGRGWPSVGHAVPYSSLTKLGAVRAKVWIDGYLTRKARWQNTSQTAD